MGTQNENLRTLELFAGAGGGVLGGLPLGHKPVCYVEKEEYCQRILAQRMDDGILPDAPIWDDVRTFDGHPWRGLVDLVCGGFPCQDISAAGGGAGIEGSQSGLWGEMARIICEARPRYAFMENSPILTSRGLHVVLGDLAAMGFDAEWCVLGARDVGAPHRRDRIWILARLPNPDSLELRELQGRRSGSSGQGEVKSELNGKSRGVADTNSQRELQQERGKREVGGWVGNSGKELADPDKERRQELDVPAINGNLGPPHRRIDAAEWWREDPAEGPTESGVGRVANGVAHRVDRIKALGNGQVPAVAAAAWQILINRMEMAK